MSINSRVSNGGYRAPPGSWDNPPSKYDRIWECYTSYLAINEQTNFTERTISESEAIRQVSQELIGCVEILNKRWLVEIQED